MTENRGTFRTTKQMQLAPKGAVFIWGNGNLSYPRELAKALERRDLEIVGPVSIDRLRGSPLGTVIVVDHAVELTPEQREILAILNERPR